MSHLIDKRPRQYYIKSQTIDQIKRHRPTYIGIGDGGNRSGGVGCASIGPITCQNCGKNGFDYDFHADEVRGDLICPDCGCCCERIYDDGPEKRNFVDGKNHSRTVEVDPFLGMITHTTIIGKGGANNQLQQTQMRLAPTETKKAGKLTLSFKTLKNVASMIECKECVVFTAKWYMKMLQDTLESEPKTDGKSKRINGTGSQAYSVAAIFLASGFHNEGYSFVDMCNKVTDVDGKLVDQKKVRRFYKEFQRILKDNLKESTQQPSAFVERIAANFELDYKVTGRALDIISRALDHKCSEKCGQSLSGMRRSTLAAACFYKASYDLQAELRYEPLRPEDVALSAGIEAGTLPAALNNLLSHWSEMY